MLPTGHFAFCETSSNSMTALRSRSKTFARNQNNSVRARTTWHFHHCYYQSPQSCSVKMCLGALLLPADLVDGTSSCFRLLDEEQGFLCQSFCLHPFPIPPHFLAPLSLSSQQTLVFLCHTVQNAAPFSVCPLLPLSPEELDSVIFLFILSLPV